VSEPTRKELNESNLELLRRCLYVGPIYPQAHWNAVQAQIDELELENWEIDHGIRSND
jgi:hypothetical protein